VFGEKTAVKVETLSLLCREIRVFINVQNPSTGIFSENEILNYKVFVIVRFYSKLTKISI